MKIVSARLNHETNTFSPVPTPLQAFGPDGPSFGDAALDRAQGTRTGLGAFIAAAQARGAQISVAVNATANPSGRVHDDAFEHMAGRIVEALRGGCDLILLDLHGAMATQSFDDGEGELLRRVRALAPHTPMAVALDLHGNISQTMVDHADLIVGFKTYPHVDMFETGAHVARLAFRMLDTGRRPALAWAQPPLLSHTLRSATGEGAMQRAVQRAQQLEADGLQAASVFAGFSLADIRDAGMSVVVVGDDAAQAQSAADELARQIWRERDGFVYASEPLEASVARARGLRASAPREAGPVLLLDHGDNVMSGGSCDTTTLLEECLRQGLRHIGMGPLADPATVAQCVAAGVGSELQVALGNKTPLGLPGGQPAPLSLQVRVRAVGDGRFRITGPIYTGETWAMGRSVVLDHAAGTLVVSERPMEPLDLGVFTSLGVDPRGFEHLILKSRMYCRPAFGPIGCGLVECDSRGVTSSDYALFDFRRVRRPIHPLDAAAALHYP
ncbi:M81 family metallopeptidase [uncultured Piscinibacter sp.]|uniref:M81 family metallopeptidase n=1 Tax=uncultured Piscinibacter sp. TaxID=1131835 RepID=UPI00262A7884|nr:M81 family metallopeptidase [uncultured Piscinibacter sp.]